MGNCFKASSHDDISLLQDSDVPDNNGESHAPVVPPPPPYQVITVNCVAFNSNMNGFRCIYLFFVLSNSVFFFSGVPLMYCCCVGTEPFRSRVNSLPGSNRPIGPWPIRSLAKSLPGAFAPWPFRSLTISFPGTFALWLFRSGHRWQKVCGNGLFKWGAKSGGLGDSRGAEPKAPRSSAIGSRRQRRSRRRGRWAVKRGCTPPQKFFSHF